MSNKIVCIEREYGSNGRNVGEWLGKRMGIACYDRKKVGEEALKRGLVESIDNLEKEEEYLLIQKTVKLLAKERSCIFIGCFAAQTLEEVEKKLTVFIYADIESRIQWSMQRDKISREEAIKLIEEKGKERADYHNSYSDTKMGELSSYDLAISSSKFGIDITAELIRDCMAHI